MRKIALLWVLIFLFACALPQDPEHTTETVRGNIMHVGVSENAPWVTRSEASPGGVEVRLVEAFADEMGAEIEWHWGSMTEHLEALAQYELHVAIGGLTAAAPGAKSVAITQPYYETRIVVGVPSGSAAPANLDDRSVGVIRGSAVAAFVREAGAKPFYFDDEEDIDRITAVPHWQLDDLNLEASGITLHTFRHVMAVPPGENRWLTELESFLQQHPPISP